MQNLTFKVGDFAWLYAPNHEGKLSKGTVEAVVRLPGYSFDHYIVSLPTGIDDVLEVRCGMSLSDGKKKPIGLYRR